MPRMSGATGAEVGSGAGPGVQTALARRGPYRVLWLIKGLGRGGAEMLLPAALPWLDRTGFEYHAGFFLPWKDALVPELETGGVPVTCFRVSRHGDPRAVKRLATHIRRQGIDPDTKVELTPTDELVSPSNLKGMNADQALSSKDPQLMEALRELGVQTKK